MKAYRIDQIPVECSYVYMPISLPKTLPSDSITVTSEDGHIEFVLARDIREIRSEVKDIKDFLTENLGALEKDRPKNQ